MTENAVSGPTKDELEALSIRYGSASGIWVVPLKSDNIAVFGRDFRTHLILGWAELTVEKLRDLRLELNAKSATEHFRGEPSDHQFKTDLTNHRRLEEQRSPVTLPRRQTITPIEIDL